MDFPRKQIKANARAALSAHYWPVVGAIFVGLLLAGGVSAVASGISSYTSVIASIEGDYASSGASGLTSALSLVGAFLSMIFGVGIAWFSYTVYRGDEPDIGNIFVAFKDGRFGRVLGGMLLVTLYTVLWSLLFLIPGIIKGYQYSMMPYLLIDRPDLTIKECFAMSKQMTDGNKWNLFVLELSFIGWAILSVFTLGLLTIFYVGPYQNLALGGAYDFLKRTRMPQAQQPVFQSATYEANYTETQDLSNNDTWNQTSDNNDNIFDE